MVDARHWVAVPEAVREVKMAVTNKTPHVHGFFLLLSLILLINPRAAAALTRRNTPSANTTKKPSRTRINIDSGWRFKRSEKNPDSLVYDARQDTRNVKNPKILKPWILPSGNDFIKDPAKRHKMPAKAPDVNVSFSQSTFDDSTWETINLPHDWAIKGPFYQGHSVPVKGGMGRLPVQGVGGIAGNLAWRPRTRAASSVLTWMALCRMPWYGSTGIFVGGWPFGYNSFRLDLTPYLKSGKDKLLAIRLDSPVESSRWYPGGGLYRSVWLTKVERVHVGQWGTCVTTKDVSAQSATVDFGC
jgi:beta-galactosidase